MDNQLSSSDHAALVTIQTEISSEMAALKAKIEDSAFSRAQFRLDYPVVSFPSDVNGKRYVPIAATSTSSIIVDMERGGVNEEVKDKANKPVVEIDNDMNSLPLMKPDFVEAEDTFREGTMLDDFPEKQSAANSAPFALTQPAEDGAAITGSSMEGIERSLSGAPLLESCSQKKWNSADRCSIGPIYEARDDSESKAGYSRMGILNKADGASSDSVDAAAVEQIQLEQALAKGLAPGSQTEGEAVWTTDWPGHWQLQEFLGQHPPSESKWQAPVLS